MKLLVGQCCHTHEPRVQALEFRFVLRVEVDTRSGIGCVRLLRPAEEDLGRVRVTDRFLAQATLDFSIAWRLAVTTNCVAGRNAVA